MFYGPGAGGDVRLGFAWTGSYCGPRPSAARVLVSGHPVVIAFTGPTPACHTSSNSKLIEGSLEVPEAPVMPAPIAWQSLTARVVLPKTVARAPIPLTVVFTNDGKNDISLAVPCPAYRVAFSVTVAGSGSLTLSTGDLCDHALTVKPGKPLSVQLGALTDPLLAKTKTGDRVTITWYMSGIESTPSATATIR